MNDLNFDSELDLTLEGMFPKRAPFSARVVREVEAEDLVALEAAPVGSKAPPIQRIRAVHHQAARLIATGMKMDEVSAVVGLCPSRLSILQADPTFKGLVEFYSATEAARFINVQERMVALGLSSAEALLERIIEAPDEVGTKELIELLKASLDRGGHAPVTKSENKNLNVTFSADELASMKEALHVAPRIISPAEAQASRPALTDQSSSHGRGALETAPGWPGSEGEGDLIRAEFREGPRGGDSE